MVYEHTKLTQHALKTACEPARERRIAQYKSDKGPEEERLIVQERCESRGGRPGLSVLTSLLVSVDVKLY